MLTCKTSLWLKRRFRGGGGVAEPQPSFIYRLLLSTIYLFSSISYDSSSVLNAPSVIFYIAVTVHLVSPTCYLRASSFSLLSSTLHLLCSTFYLRTSIFDSLTSVSNQHIISSIFYPSYFIVWLLF